MWKEDLQNGWSSGTLTDDSIYVEVINAYFYSEHNSVFDSPILGDGYEQVKLLKMIHVPEKQRKKGIATEITQFLREKTRKQKLRFAVGPIMDDRMLSIVKKLGFKGVMPFCAID